MFNFFFGAFNHYGKYLLKDQLKNSEPRRIGRFVYFGTLTFKLGTSGSGSKYQKTILVNKSFNVQMQLLQYSDILDI